MVAEKPLMFDELKQLPPVLAEGSTPDQLKSQSLYISGFANCLPQVSLSTVDLSPSSSTKHIYRIDIEPKLTEGLTLGLPPLEYTVLSHKDLFFGEKIASTRPHRPAFVPMTYTPTPKKHPKTARRSKLVIKNKPVRPLEIFPPDRRQELQDFSYPWRTVGRTVSPNGDKPNIGTGTLVGPRHMLTASHVIGWDNPGGPAISFSPSFSSNNQPFGIAVGIYAYVYRQLGGNPQDQLEVSEDYVVVVLDQRMGDDLGWMGTRTYHTDWNDAPYWLNIGYPEDLGHGIVPFWQGQVSFEDADNPGIFGQEGDGLYMDTESASLAHGNSGGPFFGHWASDGWHIVSVVSADGTLDWTLDDDNWAAGGSPMVHMVNRARSDFP